MGQSGVGPLSMAGQKYAWVGLGWVRPHLYFKQVNQVYFKELIPSGVGK